MIVDNEKAVIGMPIYLLVAIIVSTAIIAIFAISTLNIWQDSQMHQVKTEIEKIVSEAENMFEYADEGTVVTVHVDFPDSMRFVVFGSLPKNGSSEPSDHALDESMSNNYYFVMDDGESSIFHSNARFSGELISEIALFRPGTHDLTLKLVKFNGKTYVKIY